ncbi:MAG: molybdopterin converting factor subunit 1 [Thermoflexibacter sp.]|jgi:molybdopterin synthase sulfur carrier subunit|nr:molybdopterin converting factor subunit 1 [Thermoflexibacter sp.]
MKVSLMLFGITKEIVGNSELKIDLEGNANVAQLLDKLYVDYPKLKSLKSLLVAVNSEYAEKEHILADSDEIALIPPVSGG